MHLDQNDKMTESRYLDIHISPKKVQNSREFQRSDGHCLPSRKTEKQKKMLSKANARLRAIVNIFFALNNSTFVLSCRRLIEQRRFSSRSSVYLDVVVRRSIVCEK